MAAGTDLLKQRIEQVTAGKKADIGVGIAGFSDKDTLIINNKHFPLQSVFKFHIALAVLNEVDKGKLALNQEILIKKTDLLADTWSPLRDEYPKGNVKLPLAKLLSYTVSKSDNNGCDILLRLIGGPKTVENYIHSVGIKGVAIAVNEEEMRQEWNIQFKNMTTPEAAAKLLKAFNNRKFLSQKSYDFLWKIMVETSTGTDRIKGGLPVGTIVGHKTGTSDTNKQGVTAAINDIGIVKLPNGKYFTISVFVSNTKENAKTNAKIIADISKLSWAYFTGKLK